MSKLDELRKRRAQLIADSLELRAQSRLLIDQASETIKAAKGADLAIRSRIVEMRVAIESRLGKPTAPKSAHSGLASWVARGSAERKGEPDSARPTIED